MSNQDFQRESARGSRSKEASSLSEGATEAAGKVGQVTSGAAATLTGEVKQLLDRQFGGGAEMLQHIARSTNRAADDLNNESPQIAELVRAFSTRLDHYADDLRGQSIDQIIRTASDFARRQPAIVFGISALAGFFILRTIKSSPPMKSSQRGSSSSFHPAGKEYSGRASEHHGS